MHRKTSSGQALVEYGLILVLVALASVVVLAVLGPSIGINFHNAADASNNPEVLAIQQRQTDIVRGTVFFESVPTSAYTAAPPTAIPPTALPGSTLTNTPVTPIPTNTLLPPTPTPDWVYCAAENGTCTFSGTMEVRYGENGSYFYRVFTGGTPCTNAVFGDPLSGTVKHCYYRPSGVVPTVVPTNTPTATATNTDTPVPTAVSEWTFCANENATCSFSGTKEVRYGENGFYFYAIFTNTTACSNGVFGDPLVGVGKHCYYRNTTLVPTATPDLNATALAYANGTATAIANANAIATAVANANGTATAVANANATATASANATATANAIATTIAGSNATATAIAATYVSNWTSCANQDQNCSFSGTMQVRFGKSNTSWIILVLTNGTPCTIGVFGGSGTGNKCDYRSVMNSIQSVTANRGVSNTNRVNISIKLARPGSNVTITDSQSGQVLSNQACADTGTPTCSYFIILTDAQSAAGMITVSGADFNGQTYSVGYPAK